MESLVVAGAVTLGLTGVVAAGPVPARSTGIESGGLAQRADRPAAVAFNEFVVEIVSWTDACAAVHWELPDPLPVVDEDWAKAMLIEPPPIGEGLFGDRRGLDPKLFGGEGLGWGDVVWNSR